MAQRNSSARYERYYREFENGSAAKNYSYDDYDYDYDENDVRREERRIRVDELHEKYVIRRQKERARNKRVQAARLKQLENLRGISLLTCVLFCIATFVVYKLAIGYLDVNSSIAQKRKEAIEIERQYDTLKAMNDSDLEEINASVDLKEIYNTAVNDLGMVFANNNQVVTYDDHEASYVRNYEDIPDLDGHNVVDDVLGVLE